VWLVPSHRESAMKYVTRAILAATLLLAGRPGGG
jgi:hypothetical protein